MSLNYSSAEIRQVVQDVIGDILHMPVVIDAGVGGRMTLRTEGKIPASEVPRLLDQALEPHGYGLAATAEGVRVGRLADLSGGVQSNIQMLPVHHVDPAALIEVIRPNLKDTVNLSPSPGERGIIVSGPPDAMTSVRELVSLFDTDAMRHKSFALYPLSNANPASIEQELSFLFGSNGQGKGSVRFASLQRLNGILVVADDAAALGRVRQAIARLDAASEATSYIHVRPLLHRRAADVASVLAQAFGGHAPRPSSKEEPAGGFGDLRVGGGGSSQLGLPAKVPGQPDSAASEPAAEEGADSVLIANSLGLSSPVRIQADPGQNAVVVLAAPNDYKIIEAAIHRLDVKPRQVLIQAIVAEVRLSDSLKYGVDYLLSSNGLGGVSQGLSYVFPGMNANSVLFGLSRLGDVKVVSAPRILAVDNETATIQVGDQVPVLVRTSQSTVTEDAPSINDVELRDTGVILAVTPRIGAGGSVTLDTFQEVSTANRNTLSNVQSPVISVRRLQSTVSAQSGDTIAIGGLMQDSSNDAKVGVPVLQDIPLLGALFRRTEHAKERTELLVLLNPRVVGTEAEARALTEELRQKFESLAPDLGRKLLPRRHFPPPPGHPVKPEQQAVGGYRKPRKTAAGGAILRVGRGRRTRR